MTRPHRIAHLPRCLQPATARRRQAWARLTEFQRKVYRAICRIPPGQTRSYRWVAEQLGRPEAARAVGTALHRNPFAPQVPCHRIVRTDGSLGGYSRGLARKLALLRQEGWPRPAGKIKAGTAQGVSRPDHPSHIAPVSYGSCMAQAFLQISPLPEAAHNSA